MEDDRPRRRVRLERALAVAWLVAVGMSTAWVTDGGFRRRAVTLNLQESGPEVADPSALGPSPIAPVAWRSAVPLAIAAGELRAGDVVKVKAASLAGPRTVEVRVDGRPVARLHVDERWRLGEVALPFAGSRLELAAVDGRSAPVHLARLSWMNVTGWVRGPLVAWVVDRTSPDLAPVSPRRVAGGLAIAGLALLAACVARRAAGRRTRGAAPWSLAPGSAVLLLLAGTRAVSPLVVVLAWRTPAVVLLLPVAIRLAVDVCRCCRHAAVPVVTRFGERALDPSWRRRQRRAAIAVALVVASSTGFRWSRLVQDSDPRYTLLVSTALLERGSLALDGYLPGDLASTDYRLGRGEDGLFYTFPVGTSVLTAPLVAGLSALTGARAVDDRGAYSLPGELALQRTLAAFLMALLVGVVYLTARLVLTDGPAVAVAVATGFGTQVWSTASRALWSHTWSILLLAVVIHMLLLWRTRSSPPRPVLLGLLLTAMFLVRPTNAVPALVVAGYVGAVHRRALPRLALTGALGLVGFLVWSWTTSGALLPPYYRPTRLGFERFGEALLGNLVSPGRGLLVFVPAALPVLVGLVLLARRSVHAGLARAALVAIASHLVVVAGFWHWWGGHCFGPRLTCDLVPWLALGAVLSVAQLRRLRDRLPRAVTVGALAALSLLGGLGVAIHAVGANSGAAWRWNVDVDQRPAKIWDWSRPQFLAGWVGERDPEGRLASGRGSG